MSAGSILVGLVLLAALGGAMVYPWWRPPRQRATQVAVDPRQEYQALVAAIRDLDFDYQAGVVTAADYRPLRDDLAARAVSLLQDLDRDVPDQAHLEEQIEETVTALRARRRPVSADRPDGASPCPECGHLVQAQNRFCARCGAKLALSCPNCDGPVEPEDRFCGACGQMLVEEVAAA